MCNAPLYIEHPADLSFPGFSLVMFWLLAVTTVASLEDTTKKRRKESILINIKSSICYWQTKLRNLHYLSHSVSSGHSIYSANCNMVAHITVTRVFKLLSYQTFNTSIFFSKYKTYKVSLSPKETSLIRTEFLGRKGILVRGGILYSILCVREAIATYFRCVPEYYEK